jgi:hypothetical protein
MSFAAIPAGKPFPSAVPVGGQFGWFAKIGATPQAVAVLNDQPILFTIMLVVLATIILLSVSIWYIDFATRKPEQKKKKEKKGAKPPAKK